jgi:hypothetical protein
MVEAAQSMTRFIAPDKGLGMDELIGIEVQTPSAI